MMLRTASDADGSVSVSVSVDATDTKPDSLRNSNPTRKMKEKERSVGEREVKKASTCFSGGRKFKKRIRSSWDYGCL